MSFFSDNKVNEELRRNIAFQTLVASRDLIQLAHKRNQPPTYENALGLLNELAPELYEEFTQLLTRKNDSELVTYFKDLSDIKSKELEREVTPLELIEKQIATLQSLHDQDPTKRSVKSRLLEHIVAKESMQPVRLTENRILNRDFNKIDRNNYANKYFEDDFFADYQLKNDDILRIRFLHPDKDEHITGADLIYEQYDLVNDKVRFVFLQYKVWDEKGVIYKSQTKNLEPQLSKMESILCNNKFCLSSQGSKTSNKYRLPYCSGFLRPTDKIQSSDSKLMSSGHLVPICTATKLINESSRIDKKGIKGESFKSHIFEELFNSNMIGSRWIDVKTLEQIYDENDIFEKSDRIKLYAQEIINKK